jgi:hypothetical protein
MVSNKIPISELYKIVKTCSNSEQNDFCAVLVSIEDMELQKSHSGRYLLQIWTKEGLLVYSLTMQSPVHVWNLNANYLTFVKHEKEPKEP